MTFEDVNMDDFETPEPEETPEEGGRNRTFWIVVGVLGGIMILALVCIAFFGAYYLPRQRSQQETAVAEINAQNTAMALSVMQTEAGIKLPATFTPTSVQPSATPTKAPTNTQVVAKPSTPTEVGWVDPRTATVAALLTQAAEAQKTIIPTSTSLPQGGFADQVGLPGMIALAGALLVIIFLARRIRASS